MQARTSQGMVPRMPGPGRYDLEVLPTNGALFNWPFPGALFHSTFDEMPHPTLPAEVPLYSWPGKAS